MLGRHHAASKVRAASEAAAVPSTTTCSETRGDARRRCCSRCAATDAAIGGCRPASARGVVLALHEIGLRQQIVRVCRPSEGERRVPQMARLQTSRFQESSRGDPEAVEGSDGAGGQVLRRGGRSAARSGRPPAQERGADAERASSSSDGTGRRWRHRRRRPRPSPREWHLRGRHAAATAPSPRARLTRSPSGVAAQRGVRDAMWRSRARVARAHEHRGGASLPHRPARRGRRRGRRERRPRRGTAPRRAAWFSARRELATAERRGVRVPVSIQRRRRRTPRQLAARRRRLPASPRRTTASQDGAAPSRRPTTYTLQALQRKKTPRSSRSRPPRLR